MTSIVKRILAPAKAIQIWYNVKTGYDPINFACQLENVPLGLEKGGKRLEISGSDLKSQNMTQYFKFEIDWYPEKKTKFKLAMQIFVGKY